MKQRNGLLLAAPSFGLGPQFLSFRKGYFAVFDSGAARLELVGRSGAGSSQNMAGIQSSVS